MYLKASSHVTETSQPDPSNLWDRADTHTNWSFTNILLGENHHARTAGDVRSDYLCKESLKEEELEPNEDYFVTVAIWDTGNSFGRDKNYHCSIVGVSKDFPKEGYYKEEATYEQNWKPWEGYFENLSEMRTVRATFIKGTEDD